MATLGPVARINRKGLQREKVEKLAPLLNQSGSGEGNAVATALSKEVSAPSEQKEAEFVGTATRQSPAGRVPV